MAKQASAKTAKAAPKPKKAAAKRAKPAAAKSRARAEEEPPEKPGNAADALVGLLESPLVADLLAAAITAAAATVIEHKLKRGRAQGSMVKAVGAAAAAAVGRQLAAELREIRQPAEKPKPAK